MQQQTILSNDLTIKPSTGKQSSHWAKRSSGIKISDFLTISQRKRRKCSHFPNFVELDPENIPGSSKGCRENIVPTVTM